MSIVNSPIWMSATAADFYDYEINNSLRFNASDSSYLQKTFSGTGNAKTFTISFWFKRCRDGTAEYLFAGGQSVNDRFHMDINASGTFQIEAKNSGSTVIKMEGGPVLRDLGAWYHFVLRVDTTQATASDRVRLYVNGDLLTFNSNTYPPQNENLNWNVNDQVRIGRAGWATNYFDGYFAEFINVDGSALAPTEFGETKSDIWIPKDYTGSYGTNGFKLAFQDSSALGDDTSGNGHDFTANNFAASDQMPDSPTNNRLTFNGLSKDLRYSTTLSDGNKTINFTAGNDGFSCCPSTIFRSEGKAYCEFELDTAGSANATDNQAVCVFEADADIDTIGGGGNSKLAAAYNGGSSTNNAVIYDDGVSQGNPTKFTTAGQRIGVYIDYDAGKGWFSHDGTVQTVNGTPDIPAGTNPHFTFTANTPLTVGAGGIHSSGTAAKITVYENENDWETTPPSGYTSFSTNDLTDPGVDPAADETPGDYFNTVLYTANNSTQSITGVGFQPDFVWIKRRSLAAAHALWDTVRGTQKWLLSNGVNAEITTTDGLSSFDSDGFTLGADVTYGSWNNSGTHVAWNWKAGGTAVSNTDGSITSNVSANTKAGFSIVSYTGTGSNATVGHGLSSAPEMVITKARNDTTYWIVNHKDTTNGVYNVYLQRTDFQQADGNWTAVPTSSVLNLGVASVNQTSDTYVSYCFHGVEGFSKFGSYVGNNSSDGPFVYTGFRPAWLLIKRIDAASGWVLVDTVRDPFNDFKHFLYPHLPNAEDTDAATDYYDALSNGFKLRNTWTAINASGGTYIYAAFADQPFKYANAR